MPEHTTHPCWAVEWAEGVDWETAAAADGATWPRIPVTVEHYVLDLHRKGRKSAWVHDLMQIHDTEMSKR